MDHQMVARGEAASLEDIVDNQQNGHYDYYSVDKVRTFGLACNPVADEVAEAENVVAQSAYPKTQDKMPAGIGTVCDDTVYKFGQAVYDADQREDYTETGVGDSVFLSEHRHCKGEIFPDKIKYCVTYHRTDNYAPLPMPETVLCLHCFCWVTTAKLEKKGCPDKRQP